MYEVRITTTKNDDGSWYVVQIGKKVNGRWHTARTALRAEKLFSIEANMTSDEPEEYKRAKGITKQQAETYAAELRLKLV